MFEIPRPYFGDNFYYDREGKPITAQRHHELSMDWDYRRVAENCVGQLGYGDWNGVFWISTIWLGMDLYMNPSCPGIFETMVFYNLEGPDHYDQWRWPREDIALLAHKAIVRIHRGMWRKVKKKHLIRPVPGTRFFERIEK